MTDTTMTDFIESLRNEGTVDRAVRVALGLALLSLVFIGPRTLWGYVGLIPLLTGLMGFCPIYGVMGWSTYQDEPDQ